MALTASSMLPLGTPLPRFSLPEVASGGLVSSADFADRAASLVVFLCRHCPYVVHVKGELARLGRDLEALGVGMVGISSNDPVSHPEDAPESLRQAREEWGWSFPVLFDAGQEVAAAFTATCTPDFFLFGPDQRLAYRGQLDDSRPSNGLPVNGMHLRRAVQAILAGTSVDVDQRPSLGCNIKWSSGRGLGSPHSL